MKSLRLSRLLSALLSAKLLLSVMPASALAVSGPLAPAATSPGFTPPSATDCRRPIRTHEVAGQVAAAELARPEGAMAARGRSLGGAPGVAVPKSAVPASAALRESAAADSAKPPPAPSPALQAPAAPVVTAGMVDDNADFGEYLAFRARTPVEHQARDIRERYLLEVKDRSGHGVADAQVQVRSPDGAVLWARTDTGGHVWLHPDAFDKASSTLYQVTVNHAGQTAQGFLRRGQKDAVQVQLDEKPAAQRARLDLVFLVDATGSMGDEIEKLRSSLHSIAAEAARLPSHPDLCFGLVAYRDRTDPFVLRSHDFTNDLGAFQKVLNQLQADGGGDYPEAMSEALHETVHRMSWRGDGATRMVVLLADAPPQLGTDRPRYDEAMLAALGKGIKIFSVGASGLDRQGEFIQRQMAQFTGGRFVFLTYDRAGQPASGPGRETVHDVKDYSVATLDHLIVRLIREELARLLAMAS
ncbi:VWA domain-containing protein [Hydrogenophaga sp. RWCD_12]|uniref:VWA domain-containing protein n=1 Tax=Hydrogenophaga sp. RWCD_12 TaxID=3391190 RepID=UPI00398548DB